jgi:hypothetical protein
MTEIQELMARLKKMKSVRSGHEGAWQDISNYMMPFRGDITTKRAGGSRRTKPVFDSTAMIAADQLVNFMKGSLLPPSQDWLRLEPPFDYSEDVGVRSALDITSQRVLAKLQDTNFYNESTAALRDLVVLGNSCVLVEEEPVNPRNSSGIVFEAVPIGRMYWSQGKGGRIIMMCREFEMPAIDAARYFENPGEDAMRNLDSGTPMELVSYYQFVYENENRIYGGLPSKTNKTYRSVYLTESGGGSIVKDEGYDVAPYVVSRLHRVDGEEYGRGRGHLARADARGLSELRRQILMAAGKDLNPPLLVEDDSMLDMDIANGGIMVTRPPVKVAPNYLRSGADYSAADKIARDDRDQIRQAFLSDVLAEPTSQPRSAEESRQRQARSLQRLAAAADIINNEFLGPIVESVIGIMARRKELPEAVELASTLGGNLSGVIKFASPFFSAQKQDSAARVMSFLERRISLFQATQDPAFMEDIDPDRLRDFDANMSDVPSRIFRTQEEIDQIREARAAKAADERVLQQQQQMQAVEQPPEGGPQGAQQQAQ